MQEVIIYTTKTCPYCVKAKMLLTKKNAKYKEIDVSNSKDREDMMSKTNNAKTVPQIFIGSKHVGGCDDLYQLESDGKLDNMLKS